MEALAKLIYDHWFVQFDFPDANGKPYKSSGGKMVWNEKLKREIPDRWEVKQLPEIANYLFGNPFDSSLFNDQGHGFPIVRIRNVRDGFTADSTTESASDAFVIKNGDIYFLLNYIVSSDQICNAASIKASLRFLIAFRSHIKAPLLLVEKSFISSCCFNKLKLS